MAFNEESPPLETIAFDAYAKGIFETATDPVQGQAALVEAYKSNTWANPDETLEALAFYGEQMRNLYKDQSLYGDIGEQAPVKYEDIYQVYGDTITNDLGLQNKWEEENLNIIKDSKDPNIVVDRRAYEDSVKLHASKKRGEIYQAGVKGSAIGGTVIEDALNIGAGIGVDVAASVAPVINVAMMPFVKDPDVKKFATEILDPEYQQSWTRAIAGAGGQAAAIIAAPIPMLAGQAINAVSETVERKQETYRLTGDAGAAREAAAIEGASQAVGFAGEKIGLGALGYKVAGKTLGKLGSKTVSTVGGVALAEGGTEAIQQVGSNIAENIQRGQDRTTDIGRGVAKAGVAGAFAGGVASAGVSVFASQPDTLLTDEVDFQNPAESGFETVAEVEPLVKLSGLDTSNERQQEADEFGRPITPQVIQRVADQQAIVEDFVIQEGEEDLTSIPSTKEVQEEILEPSYELEDGTVAATDSEGNIVNINPNTGKPNLANDTVIYLPEKTAAHVMTAIGTGEAQLTLNSEGEAVLRSTKDDSADDIKVETLPTPTEGAYAIPLSAERSPNKLQVVRQMGVPRKITKVLPARSLGAEGPTVTEQQKETTFSRRLAATEGLTGAMEETGKKGIYYTPLSAVKDIDPEVLAVSNGTIDGLINYITAPGVKDERVQSRAVVTLANLFMSAYKANAGDIDGIQILNTQWNTLGLADKLALTGTYVAQALSFRRGMNLESVNSTSKATSQAINEAFEEEAIASGVDVADIRAPERIDTAIAGVQEEIIKTQQQDEEPLTQQENLTKQVVEELEAEGDLEAQKENELVAQEVATVAGRIEATESKLQRKRDKVIERVQAAIAADSIELASEIEAAQEVSEMTKEQVAAQQEQLLEKFKEASKTATAEVKAAVQETRRQAAAQKKLKVSALQASVNKAAISTAKLIEAANTQIAKINTAASNTTDPALQQAAQQKVEVQQTKVATAKQKLAQLKAELQVLKDTPEIPLETESLLQSLESGVDIAQVPTKKGRRIQVTTKAGGLNLASLFKKSKGEALPALSALASSINNLTNTVTVGTNQKAQATAKIQRLQSRIAKNKQLVEKAKQADPAKPSERRAIDRDKKYLESLQKRPPATAESKLPKAKAIKLAKYKLQLKNIEKARTSKPKSEKIQELEKQLRALETKKAMATRANKQAKQAAAAKVQQAVKAVEEIAAKESVIQSLPDGGQKRRLERELTQQKAAYTNPTISEILYRMFISNALLPSIGAIVGVGSMALGGGAKAFSLGVGSTFNMVKDLNLNAQALSPFTAFMSEFTNPVNWKKGLDVAKTTLTSGDRIGFRFSDRELATNEAIYAGSRVGRALEEQQQIRETDLVKYVDSLQYEALKDKNSLGGKLYSATKNALIASAKTGRFMGAGHILRLFPALEAIMSVPLMSAFDKSAANYYYNKQLLNLKKGAVVKDANGVERPMTVEDLIDWKYDTKANRDKAKAQAAEYAQKLNAAGIKFSEASQKLLEEEVYQSLIPKDASLSASRQVGQLNLNAPASGMSGVISQIIMAGAQKLADTAPYGIGNYAKFLVPFANSSANVIGFALEFTPFGILQSNTKTAYERHIAMTTSVIGTTAMAGLFLAIKAELEKPEEERLFDIIGNKYSTNNAKNSAFKQAGGILNSIRIGNIYIPYTETPFVLLLGAVGAYADNVRSGKEVDPGVLGFLSTAIFGSMEAATQISMLRGIEDIASSIGKVYRDEKNAGLALARGLLNPIKTAVIPASGLLKTISRYTDRPVEAWKDAKSYLVEGVPGLQTYAGKHKLNIFGESLEGNIDTALFRRFFSTKSSDLDMRWLVDNNYHIPSVNNLEVSKSEAVRAGLRVDDNNSIPSVTEDAKAAILKEAGPKMRETVAQYRKRYGGSKHSEKIQEKLSDDINRHLTKATVNYYRKYGEKG